MKRPVQWVFAAVASGGLLGCVEVGGRLRPAWRNGFSDIATTARPLDEHPLQPLMLVVVNDMNAQPLPGVEVLVSGAKLSDPLVFRTSADGTARPTVGPGEWQVIVSLQGFRSVSRRVSVRSGERCTIQFYVRFMHEETVTTLTQRAA